MADYIYKGKVHLWWISGLAALIKVELLFINRMDGIRESLDLSTVPYLNDLRISILFVVLKSRTLNMGR